MASSGVKCADGVLCEYKKLGSKKEFKYIIFKISDDKKTIEVDKTGGNDKTFDDLKSDLPKDKCRYAVFDLSFKSKEDQQRDKIIFISHSPDDISDRMEKMLYSSSKKALVDKLGSGTLQGKFHYGDHSDIDMDEIVRDMKTKFA